MIQTHDVMCALIAKRTLAVAFFTCLCGVLAFLAVDALKRPDRDMGGFIGYLVSSILCIPALGITLCLQCRDMARHLQTRSTNPGDVSLLVAEGDAGSV
jgi:hypothetical protein